MTSTNTSSHRSESSVSVKNAGLMRCTLVVPRNRENDSILLAQKARGLGAGKWLAFGGKLQPGEAVEVAALREFEEETGVTLRPDQISKIGLLLFSFQYKPDFFIEVHVYETYAVSDIPVLCDEFYPPSVWYVREELPIKKMWPDFVLWSDFMFKGQRFRARISYSDFDTMIKFDADVVHDNADPLAACADWMSSKGSQV